jgi:ABC-2 type transport system ATP-binding protein
VIVGFEQRNKEVSLYSFADQEEVEQHINSMSIKPDDIHKVWMTLEDAFIGLMGKY